MIKKFLTFCLALTVSACASHEIPEPARPLTFDGPSYRFNVSRVDVVDDFSPTPRQRTEAKPDVSLAKAMHRWVDEKLSAGGSANVLEVRITEAGIVKKDIPKQKSGIEGLFTKEQTEEYNGKLSVELKLYTPDRTLPAAHAEVSAELSRTLREDATLQDRKAMYRSMTAEIMRDMTQALDRNIRSYFSNYLQ